MESHSLTTSVFRNYNKYYNILPRSRHQRPQRFDRRHGRLSLMGEYITFLAGLVYKQDQLGQRAYGMAPPLTVVRGALGEPAATCDSVRWRA